MLYKYLRPLFQIFWMWIFPQIKLSWHFYPMWHNLGWLNWFWQFLLEGLPSFNPKRFSNSYVWSCSLSEKGLPFPWDLPLTKLCGFLLVFDWLYFTQYLTSFSFINHLLRRYAQFAISISSNIDEFPSVNPSADVFVFGDFNIHHKDWLTYSGVTDRPGELCYKFS